MKTYVKVHKTESAAEQRAVRPLFTGMQVFPPTTPLTQNGVTHVTMPRESRAVRYIRYIDPQTGVIRFVPADMAAFSPDCDHGIEVVAQLDGEHRTYAPMPEGVRYRRFQDETTGEMIMIPIPNTVKIWEAHI